MVSFYKNQLDQYYTDKREDALDKMSSLIRHSLSLATSPKIRRFRCTIILQSFASLLYHREEQTIITRGETLLSLSKDKTYHIPAEATLDVIGGKWKTLTLCHLSYGPMRSNELMRRMPQITRKMLTQSLRELEADGIITRTVFQEVPPKVVYELTELGQSLKPLLQQLCDWGEQFINQTRSNHSASFSE